MDNSQKSGWQIDRVFQTPPWRSRSFLVFTSALLIFLFGRLIVSPGSGNLEQDAERFGFFLGGAIIDLISIVLLPYLLLLVLEIVIKRAHLNLNQTTISQRLAIAVSVVCALVLAVLNPPFH